MNYEFIVWNKYSKEFIKEKYLNMYASSADGKYFYDCSDPYEFCESLYCKNEYEIFNYIGFNDIDGKKIYADCSIVEFEWLDDNGLRLEYKKANGFFTYCNKFCAYNVKNIETNELHSMTDELTNIKIIDTIQENKLGFIK